MQKIRIKKNDKVRVRVGKDRGKLGKVLSVDRERMRVTVEGVNLIVKHIRPKREQEKGQRIQFPSPMSIAKVSLLCPKCGKQTRIRWKMLENKKKVRVCHVCSETID